MEKILKVLSDAKMTIATIGVIITSFIGAYQLASEYFVTKVYAMNMINDAQTQIHHLKRLNVQNTTMILELRMLKYEGKLERTGKLTPTEKREYDYLQKKIDALDTLNIKQDNLVPIK